uniref:Uncharacterized protein n=1 Tax=Ciona intestinalis TaxID=7719 RepID=H2XU78_CIOIN
VSVNLAYHPANSQYLPTSQVTYHCSDGRSVIPASSRTITCMVSGSWSISVAPTCQAVCVKPPAITIGSGSYSPMQNTYQPNENITYSCNGTTRLVGSATNICGSNFGWSTVAPQCDIACSAPPPPNANSSVGLSSASFPYSVGTTAKYSCSLGYRLVGIETLTCTSEGWVPAAPPTCQLVCLNPPLPVNGTVLPNVPANSGYDLGTTIRYTCTGTNNIIGSSINICQNDGSWRYAAIPVCSSVCYSAPTIPNGDYMPKQIYANPGTSVSYSCNTQSHQIRGSIQATCQAASLTWSTAPVCLTVVCGNPPAIANGMNSLNGGNAFLEGDKVNYTCNAGYRITPALSTMNPLNENTCTSTANDLPSCEPITCRPPPTLSFGSFLPVMTYYNASATVNYTCNSGFTLIGSNNVTCSNVLTWSQQPICAIRCVNPPMIGAGNGSITPVKASYVVGDIVQYTCMPPYRIIGTTSNECVQAGDWLHNAGPECYDGEQCYRSDPTMNQFLIQPDRASYLEGTTITFTCRYNAKLTGSTNATCQRNTTWDAPLPKCELKGCGPPPQVTVGNATLTPSKPDFMPGEVVTYTCGCDLTLVGKSTTICQNNNTWSNQSPQCLTKCTRPTIATGSKVQIQPDQQEYLEGTNITFTCANNVTLTGAVSSTCLGNTTWDATLPTC